VFRATSIPRKLIEEASPKLNFAINIEELWVEFSGICRVGIFGLMRECPLIWSRVRVLEVKIAVFVGMDAEGKRWQKLVELEKYLGRVADRKVEYGGGGEL